MAYNRCAPSYFSGFTRKPPITAHRAHFRIGPPTAPRLFVTAKTRVTCAVIRHSSRVASVCNNITNPAGHFHPLSRAHVGQETSADAQQIPPDMER